MKTIIFLSLTLGIFSCHTHETESEALNNVIIQSNGQELDQALTLWFDEFTQNQAMGFDMHQADHLATKKALINSK